MATGKLGSVSTTANTNHVLYVTPDNVRKTNDVYINVCNPGNTDAVLKIGVGNGASPAAGEYLENGAIVPANGGVFERSIPFLGGGNKVFVETDVAGCNATIFGDEE